MGSQMVEIAGDSMKGDWLVIYYKTVKKELKHTHAFICDTM